MVALPPGGGKGEKEGGVSQQPSAADRVKMGDGGGGGGGATMAEDGNERRYLDILLGRIRTCEQYDPKFGQGGGGLSYGEFQTLYRVDRFYSWLGMNSPAVCAARRSFGGLASLCRQIGSGCEELFRSILQDTLGLAAADVRRSFKAPGMDGVTRTLRLDARVDLGGIRDDGAKTRFREWMGGASASIGAGSGVAGALKGAVFEVRQGYKSKDSKR